MTIAQGFWLSKYEATQEQWESVMGTTPWSGQSDMPESPSHPAFLTWNEAQKFVHALNKTESDSLYRLPSEAEWEYACRAGTTTRWSFGDDESQLGEYAWHDGNSWGSAQVVGQKLPNPWGLYDMHGNVYEWCQDRYGPYPSSARTDPTGHAFNKARIIRGGPFFNSAEVYLRSASRNTEWPENDYGGAVGVRLLKRKNE